MNKTRKINLLYQLAHRQRIDVTKEEQREFKKNSVCAEDSDYTTKANIRAYITAADNGYHFLTDA